ncbi:hypothetical protein CRYUN_Cryun22dG0103200 [Craigia yunnanensis]
MDEIFGGNGGEKDELRTVFLGNFIQFLCSLVEQFSFVEELDDSLDKHVILSKIINLVTKLLYWCLGKKGAYVNTCMSRYFRHSYCCICKRSVPCTLGNSAKHYKVVLLCAVSVCDDVLFKLLLQLLSVQACEEQQFHKERWASQDVREDVLFHVSNIFNPIHIFHLFLAEASLLHPNHAMSSQGSPFFTVQQKKRNRIYNQKMHSISFIWSRCLRWVCDSWQTFTEFSVFGEVKNQSSSKRRKVSSESSNFKIEPSSEPAKIIPLYLEKKLKGDFEYRYAERASEQAKDCLLSLKKSVENLHLKNLFPYKPDVLLKRLTRFQ